MRSVLQRWNTELLREGTAGAIGKDLGIAMGDEDGVLEVGRGFPVFGDDCPAVVKDAHTGDAGVDHGFDSEGHTGHMGRGFTTRTEVWDLRVLVKFAAYAMANELADNAEAEGLCIFGDGTA